MLLSSHIVESLGIISPWSKRTKINGVSYGAGPASYDIRIAQDLEIKPTDFALASSIEEFRMPDNVAAMVLDKSTHARRGLGLFNTFIDPGWQGFLTMELVNNGYEAITLSAGDPIAQIVFLDVRGKVTPYDGKYQNQADMPVGAILDV